MQSQYRITLVSSCLVGLCTRYDCQLKASQECISSLHGKPWAPVCPEQLGGLTTPREAADIHGGDGFDVLEGKACVLTKSGVNVTTLFIHGAEQVLLIAKAQPVDTIYLKSRSPSCGVDPTAGVTAALLLRHGYRLLQF